MAVNRDNIRMYLINGEPIIGELYCVDKDNNYEIHYPFRIVPSGDGKISVAAVFLKEEWIKVNPAYCSSFMEISVLDTVRDMFVRYQQEVWSGIILPGQSGIIT